MANDAFTHYVNRRKGITKALTDDLKLNIEKCKGVMPGSTYTQRYILVGLHDGAYEIRHPKVDEVHAPPCLPPYHGQVTKALWLTIALESADAWLASTLMSDVDVCSMAEDERKSLLEKVRSLSNLQEDVMTFYEKRPADEVEDLAADLSAASNVLSPCENKACMFVGESERAKCLVCQTWYHCICIGISRADDYHRFKFICGSC